MVIITNILEIEQHLDGITSVIFDLDDTLYSEKQYVRSGYKAVAKRMGNNFGDILKKESQPLMSF